MPAAVEVIERVGAALATTLSRSPDAQASDPKVAAALESAQPRAGITQVLDARQIQEFGLGCQPGEEELKLEGLPENGRVSACWASGPRVLRITGGVYPGDALQVNIAGYCDGNPQNRIACVTETTSANTNPQKPNVDRMQIVGNLGETKNVNGNEEIRVAFPKEGNPTHITFKPGSLPSEAPPPLAASERERSWLNYLLPAGLGAVGLYLLLPRLGRVIGSTAERLKFLAEQSGAAGRNYRRARQLGIGQWNPDRFEELVAGIPEEIDRAVEHLTIGGTPSQIRRGLRTRYAGMEVPAKGAHRLAAKVVSEAIQAEEETRHRPQVFHQAGGKKRAEEFARVYQGAIRQGADEPTARENAQIMHRHTFRTPKGGGVLTRGKR